VVVIDDHPARASAQKALPRTNGMAVAALVLGILWGYGVLSLLAIIFGMIGRKQTRDRYQAGHGLATAGIVLGVVGVLGAVGITLVAVTTSGIGSGAFFG
jgi:hypothetical protein